MVCCHSCEWQLTHIQPQHIMDFFSLRQWTVWKICHGCDFLFCRGNWGFSLSNHGYTTDVNITVPTLFQQFCGLSIHSHMYTQTHVTEWEVLLYCISVFHYISTEYHMLTYVLLNYHIVIKVRNKIHAYRLPLYLLVD